MGIPLILALCASANERPAALAAEQANEVVQRSLETYCAKHGAQRDQFKPAGLTFLPGMQSFRYPLPAVVAEKKYDSLHERLAIVFVDPVYGGIIEFKKLHYDDHKKIRRDLLAAMALTGRRVTNSREAKILIANLFALDGWLTGHNLDDYKPPSLGELLEGEGPYRGRPNTYGRPHGPLTLVGGDDFGFEVDSDGYVIAFLCGHIR